ncbi:hypothetical protein M8818_001329 [Zalaria obscura]|uniref:Uncharacterized protein n=1 Tax=Zalaria obscura TaxID=2024903 RepID=A0ACC3SLR8_9PEZI
MIESVEPRFVANSCSAKSPHLFLFSCLYFRGWNGSSRRFARSDNTIPKRHPILPNLQHNPPRHIAALQLLIDLRQLPKLPHKHPRLDQPAPHQLHRIKTLLQTPHQIPPYRQPLNHNRRDARQQMRLPRRDPATAQRPARLQHVRGGRERSRAARCHDHRVCACAVGAVADFVDHGADGGEVDEGGAERGDVVAFCGARVDADDARAVHEAVLDGDVAEAAAGADDDEGLVGLEVCV